MYIIIGHFKHQRKNNLLCTWNLIENDFKKLSDTENSTLAIKNVWLKSSLVMIFLASQNKAFKYFFLHFIY